ncbi:MAG: hypothetical protein AAGA67_05340 [Cyanobacteria bacterium P01_F01_bin.153]
MIFGSSWLRSSSVVLSALGLSLVMAACGGAGDSEPSADISSSVRQSSPAASPEIPATASSPSEVAPSSGDRPNSVVYPDMEIVGATADEGLNIFYEGWTERCANTPTQRDLNCARQDVVGYFIGKERITANVDCINKSIGDYVFEDGTYGEGMSPPIGEGMQNLVQRACQSLMYKEGPVGEGRIKAAPVEELADEPAGEPGYAGYDIVGNTESGEPVYFISSQPVCEADSSRPDCDRHEVNLVIGEANSSAVVFCSTGNFNELTINGTLVSYLMQPKNGVYSLVVDRVCSE